MAKLLVNITSLLLLRITFAFNHASILNSRHALSEKNYHCLSSFETKQLRVFTAIEAGGVTTDDQPDADAFTAYMAKSHEDKLRAVKDAEEKKNAEIKILKEKIKEMESGSDAKTGQPAVDMSAKLEAYQTFISQYILKAQEEKIKAVKAAEEAIFKKYEDKLSALMLNSADSKSITIADKSVKNANAQDEPVDVIKDTSSSIDDPRVKLYLERTKTIANAAKAGAHNRWGPMEEKSATDYVSLSLAGANGAAIAAVEKNDPVPPEVIAADHGLRADGGVGGPSLADRVNLGAQLLAER